jgi:hypothetical protein
MPPQDIVEGYKHTPELQGTHAGFACQLMRRYTKIRAQVLVQPEIAVKLIFPME